MVDVELGTQLVEFVVSSWRTFAQTKEAVRELFVIVGQDRSDLEGASTLKIPQEAPGGRHDAHGAITTIGRKQTFAIHPVDRGT